MKIINTKIYALEESIIRSGYPMQTGEPLYKHSELSDTNRALKLAGTQNGTGHNNFLKGIIVQFDMQYPEYLSPQLQRYHWIDIVSSQSKMHKLMSKPLLQSDFVMPIPDDYLKFLNKKIEEKNFATVINCLPCGYLKWMGVSTNYLQLKTIYNQRKNHKLKEWKYICEWIKSLEMSTLITNE